MLAFKYGFENIIVMLLLGTILIVAGYFVKIYWLSPILYFTGCLLVAFTLWFFRDPNRTVPAQAMEDKSIIMSPADGKVIGIIDVREDQFLHSEAKQISIFLSPLNVHVNRIPFAGVVKFFEYIPGKYLVAYHPKSSDLNEQTRIGVESEHGKVFFKQIVGVVARRLAWDIKVGDTVEVGDRFGMMKFGSRMDIIVKPDSEINVKVGDRVVAGETIIAKLK